jgi:16S rRNA (uracil1498-N3)-methyltransferase
MNVPRRFFVSPEALAGEREIELGGEELRHAARVLRVEPGEEVELLDGLGRVRRGTVGEVATRRIVVRPGPDAPSREPARSVALAAALLDSDAFDRIVRDATQLGVSTIVPLVTERVRPGLVRGAAGRVDRWERIAREAVKQCGRARVPVVTTPAPLEELLSGRGEAVGRRGRWLDAEGEPFGAGDDGSEPLLLFTGPEGGWTPRERERLSLFAGAAWSLGSRALRAETAALAALARVDPDGRRGAGADQSVLPSVPSNELTRLDAEK